MRYMHLDTLISSIPACIQSPVVFRECGVVSTWWFSTWDCKGGAFRLDGGVEPQPSCVHCTARHQVWGGVLRARVILTCRLVCFFSTSPVIAQFSRFGPDHVPKRACLPSHFVFRIKLVPYTFLCLFSLPCIRSIGYGPNLSFQFTVLLWLCYFRHIRRVRLFNISHTIPHCILLQSSPSFPHLFPLCPQYTPITFAPLRTIIRQSHVQFKTYQNAA